MIVGPFEEHSLPKEPGRQAKQRHFLTQPWLQVGVDDCQIYVSKCHSRFEACWIHSSIVAAATAAFVVTITAIAGWQLHSIVV